MRFILIGISSEGIRCSYTKDPKIPEGWIKEDEVAFTINAVDIAVGASSEQPTGNE